MQYNPGWNNSSVNLLHVQAVGPSDTLHYVWSSIGAPAVLLVATESRSSVLRVNWTQLLSPAPAGAVWIDPPSSVVYSAAIVFTKVALREVGPALGELPRGGGGRGGCLGQSRALGSFPSCREMAPCVSYLGYLWLELRCCLETFGQGSSFWVSFLSLAVVAARGL